MHHLRARHPIVMEYDGEKPVYEAPNPASVQAMDSLRWLIQQMYEIAGISQLAASSKNTLGPNASGKAIDTMEDIQSDRFSQLEGQQAMGRVDLGMILLDGAKMIAADKDIDRSKKAPWIREIEWDKFDFDNGAYHLTPEPINFLPDTRAGKLDALGDLGKIPGLLTNPMQTASLFEEPDIQRTFRHLLGPYRMLEKVMEMLGDEGVSISDCVPTPQMQPELAKQMAEGELGNAYSEGAGDELLGRYRWFLQMLEELQKIKMTPPATSDMGQGPPGLPPGPPDAPTGPGPMGPPGPPGAPGIPDLMGGGSAQLAAGMLPPGVS